MAPSKKNGTNGRGSLSERIEVLRADMEGSHQLILEKLKPLDEIAKLREDVDKHSTQISFWRGGQAVIVFAITAILGYFGIHRHS